MWGLLRVEWEAIKVRGEREHRKLTDVDEDGREGFEMTPMQMTGGVGEIAPRGSMPLVERIRRLKCTSDMSRMSKVQILGELCLYTTAFAVVGLVAAAHRETL